jgi:hypothetical protein
MTSQPIPIDLIRLRAATTAYLGVVEGCQATVEAFAQTVPGDDRNEPARELATQVEAALDPDRAGSAAAVLVAVRGVLAE